MPTFKYKAKKNLNETVEGTIVSESQDMAMDKLSQMGLSPIRLVAVDEPTAEKPRERKIRMRGGRLKQKDLTIFTNQLKSLMRARVDLLRALNIVYSQTDKQAVQVLVSDLHATIKRGETFSQALARHKDFFPSLYVDLIRTGEASGRLDEVLEELAGFLGQEEEFKSHVKTAMAYPILMISVGVCVIFVLFAYVIPKLAGIFSDFDAKLPLPTEIMMSISGFFQSWWWTIILGLGVFVGVLVNMKKSEAGKRRLDWIKLRIPIFSKLILKQSLARFCTTLSLLIRSGLPAFQALGIAIPTMGNIFYVERLQNVKKDVSEGVSLANSMKTIPFFPPFLIQMISVGEEGGRLEGVLKEVAAVYEEEVEAQLKVITSLLEPVIILVLGLVLGAIVLAMLLPIFQINTLIK